MCTAVKLQLTAIVENGTDDRGWYLIDYGCYDVQIERNITKFYCTFNYCKLVKLTFKFWLKITHEIMIMPPNFAEAMYKVNQLLTR